jgi:hypothetical protein
VPLPVVVALAAVVVLELALPVGPVALEEADVVGLPVAPDGFVEPALVCPEPPLPQALRPAAQTAARAAIGIRIRQCSAPER